MVVKIHLKKSGSLSKYGYALASSITQRHRAIAAAVAEYGSAYVIKKLNVLAVYRKNNPKLSAHLKILRQDIAYVQKLRNAMSKATRLKNLATTRAHFKLPRAFRNPSID